MEKRAEVFWLAGRGLLAYASFFLSPFHWKEPCAKDGANIIEIATLGYASFAMTQKY